MATDIQTISAEIAAHFEAYSGLPEREIVDAMNTPRKTGSTVTYRAVESGEAYDAISADSKAKLQKAAEDYSAAANAAQRAAAAAGVALYDRIGLIGSVEVEQGTAGRAELDAAVTNGYLLAAERDAVVALGTVTVPTMQTLWQAWGWSSSVTIAQVEEALS
jgi:hypothetical protein